MVLVVAGLLNKRVGAQLGISEVTVKAHRGRLMRKMEATSLPDLVQMAVKLGVLQPGVLTPPTAPRNIPTDSPHRPAGGIRCPSTF